MTLDDESLTVSVAVTNSGKIAGADVVEIYVRPPYTGRMEKAKKVLAAIQNYLKDSFIPRGGDMPTVGADYGLKFSDVADKDYHDPAWGRFTEQFTIEEMIHLVTFVKHFALNEEDAHRTNVHTWCSEQAIREIYAKPFEIAVKEGNTHGIMSALNDIGVHWCGECEALLTGLLREEWDFKGAVVSDFASFTYQRSDTGVPAGNDLWLAPMNNNYYIKSLQKAYKKDPAGIARALQGAAKHICYMVARSNVTQKQHKLPPK